MTQTLRLIRILMLFCLDHRWLYDSLGSLRHGFDGSERVILTEIGHEILDTPGKINMEPENAPLEKENHLHKPSFSGSMLIFEGVSQIYKVFQAVSDDSESSFILKAFFISRQHVPTIPKPDFFGHLGGSPVVFTTVSDFSKQILSAKGKETQKMWRPLLPTSNLSWNPALS